MMKIQSPKLLDRGRQALRTQHDALDTEKADVNWIKRFIFSHNVRHPAQIVIFLEINDLDRSAYSEIITGLNCEFTNGRPGN